VIPLDLCGSFSDDRKLPPRADFAGGNPMSRQGFFIFQVETIDAMRRAFEEVCGALQLRKDEPSSALAAERILQLAKEGERDPALLASRVIAQFSRP
jgi:hypothetical protein